MSRTPTWILVVMTTLTLGQQFEVGSVKANRSDVPWQDDQNTCGRNGMGIVRTLPGARVRAQRIVLSCLIQGAYNVRPFQVTGGPDWVNKEHFDVDAKASDPATTGDQLRLMLQSLLHERFGLQVHREVRELPVFELGIAKGGSKMRRSRSCDETRQLLGPPPPPAPGQAPAPLTFPCGHIGGAGSPGGSRIDGDNVSIAELIRYLTLQLRRPVIDKTGLNSAYDVHLTYAGTNPLSTESTDTAPTLFDAMQRQLGLTLRPSRGPVEVVVIDSVQRPSSN